MEQNAEKAIEVKNVKKIYRMGSERICAVDGVSFDIMDGEFCCLLGTSGSGKSTLLNLMAGIEKTTNGEIIIKGRKIHKMSENSLARFRQRYLGFVFQSYNLIGSMTALENVEFPLVFKKVPGKKRRKMARDMLIKVGLKTRLKHRPKEMSGGQQQRVGIARAFVAKPEIVFADEPTGNLDTRTTMEVMDLIKSIAKENHQTIVMVTHDPRLAAFADKIIHILDGKIQNIEIIAHPQQCSNFEEADKETAAAAGTGTKSEKAEKEPASEIEKAEKEPAAETEKAEKETGGSEAGKASPEEKDTKQRQEKTNTAKKPDPLKKSETPEKVKPLKKSDDRKKSEIKGMAVEISEKEITKAPSVAAAELTSPENGAEGK